MRKITQTIVGTIPPLDKNVIWLDNTDNTAPVEKVFINGVWTPMGVDTDDYYTKEEVNDKLDEKLNVIENPVNGNLVTMNAQGQVTNSGKKTTDFIATPIDSGSEGEVLSVDSEGNPVWTTVTPTGTADTEMSNTSTNAVQNKVIKGYVDNNFANKDGYYSTLTAGSAENLVGQTVDSEAYLIRPTGGTENEVANGVASVVGIEGESCVWNQKFQFLTSTKTTTGEYIYNRYSDVSFPNGHKVYVRLKYICTTNYAPDRAQLSLSKGDKTFGSSTAFTPIKDSNEHLISVILTSADNGNNSISLLYNWSSTVASSLTAVPSSIILSDLTLLGIDNLTTTAQVEAWFAQHVGTKPYYVYNAGTILSAQTLGIKTYGQNLLNPTTRQAKLIPYTWVEDGTTYSNQYTIKNIPSGATATFTPDNTGVAETVDISSGTLDITSYGSGILELSAANANTYVCMKWNGTKDDDVVPYEDLTHNFDVRKVYGKSNGVEYQCYPNGMKSAGSIHDTLTANEAVVKVGSVDLGTLTWTRTGVSTDNVYRVTKSQLPLISNTISRKILCSKYKFAGGMNSMSQMPDKSIDNNQLSTSGIDIVVKDSSYPSSTTSVDQFKAAMSGVILNYQLATPITYTDLIYRDNGVDRPLADVLMNITVNNWSMEEQLLTPYEDGNPTSIPATIKTQYGMDAVEAIDTLQKTCYFADDVHANLQALLTCINTNCAETLGGTFAISETATDKVFAFSFTPNVEPTNEGE